MRVFIFFATLAAFGAPRAYADDVRANTVMVCKDAAGSISRVEALALYEARSFFGISIDLGTASLGYLEKLEIAFSRLARFDRKKAEAFRKAALTLISDANIVRGVELVHSTDVDSGIIAPGCSLSTAMVTELRPGRRSDMIDVKATLNADLWDRLTEDDRAVFVLNELIRRQTIHPTLDHPRGIRYLAGLLSSSRSESFSVAEMVPHFIAGRMRTIIYNHLDLELWQPNGANGVLSRQTSFYPDGKLASGFTSELSSYFYKTAEANYRFRYLQNRAVYFESDGFPKRQNFAGIDIDAPEIKIESDLNHHMVSYRSAEFYPNRTLKKITIPSKIVTPLFTVEVNEAEFSPNWKLTSIKRKEGTVGKLKLGSAHYTIFPDLKFDPSGKTQTYFYHIHSLYAASNVPHLKVDGVDLLVEGAWVSPSGEIEKFRIKHPSQISIQGKSVAFNGTMLAYSNETLRAGTLHQDARLEDAAGNSRLYKKGNLLHFDSNGKVTGSEANDTVFWEAP